MAMHYWGGMAEVSSVVGCFTVRTNTPLLHHLLTSLATAEGTEKLTRGGGWACGGMLTTLPWRWGCHRGVAYPPCVLTAIQWL
jgi:hypothetical protein